MLRLAPLALLALLGCAAAPAPAPDAGPADAGPPEGFIALDRDFAGYRAWPSFDITPDGGPAKRVFIRALPPMGASAFPVGTVIVKETGPGPAPELDAMAKRGGTFNADAAPGWEFFGLQATDAGDVLVQWRGTGSWQTGGGYANTGRSCAACHGEDRANDCVQSPPLQLR